MVEILVGVPPHIKTPVLILAIETPPPLNSSVTVHGVGVVWDYALLD